MEWLEFLVLLINAKTNHRIEYRILYSCGRRKFYLICIDGTKYRTDEQVAAKKHLRGIMGEELVCR